jgi:AraC-like DNA-binding protein
VPYHAIDSEHRAMTTDAKRLTSRAKNRQPNASADATQPASSLRAFTDALDRLGYDVASLLANAGLRRSDLDDPDGSIPCTAFDQVIGSACGERRIPNLGARLAAVTPIGAFPLLDYLVVSADTVGGALDQLVRYFHLVDAPVMLSVVHDDGSARLVVERATNPFIEQYETSIAVHHLRAETERRLGVSFVALMHEPDDTRELERQLGCPVRVPSTWSGIEFSRGSLQLPLRRRDPALRRVLEGHAASVVTRQPSHDDRTTFARVRAALASRLGRGVPSIDLVAKQLAIAPRTLQRRLAAEDLSYLQVVDIERREAAERLLVDASLAVGEIGYLLGFSEPSAFHRAFKRWHQMTPLEYRGSVNRL